MQPLMDLSLTISTSGALTSSLQDSFQRDRFPAQGRRSRFEGRESGTVSGPFEHLEPRTECDIFGSKPARHQPTMNHNDEEFAALRSTIRDRGTVRMILLPVTFGLWAATAGATTAAIQLPIAGLVPLPVLAAGFESN